MDDNPEQQLAEKIEHCQKTARNLMKKNRRLRFILEKRTDTTDDSTHPVKQSPLTNDATKQLMDIDLALKSNQQQLKLAFEQYLSTQSDLPTSEACSTIQSDNNHEQIGKVAINQQVKLSDDNNGQNDANLNPTVQVRFTGTLPDDFYLHLMSVMGIQECLINNRLVCSFWNELVLERCNSQKSLKLFETFDCLMNYGELLLKCEKTEDTSLILKSIGDDLIFEGLETDHVQLVKSLYQEDDTDEDDTEECKIQTDKPTREKKLEASKVLTALFPSIEELALCTEEVTLINVEHLLQFYAEQLTSLTMTNFGIRYDDPGSKLRAFSFPMLKSLNTFKFSLEDEQVLSLLPQLESLTLYHPKISLETLLRAGTQLEELNINCIKSVYSAPVDEFSKRPPINSNLRKLSINFLMFARQWIYLQVLEIISHNLTSLESLKLDLYTNWDNSRILHSVTSYLVPLHQLHSLTLEADVSFFLLHDNQLAEILPLPSVRQLKLLLGDFYSRPAQLVSSAHDRFSQTLFTAFPNVEQVLIAFKGNGGRVKSATFAALKTFAGKHSNVVQLFRSGHMSRFTNLPNAVTPLLGNHRQMYGEYIEEEELFGMAICKLTASLVTRQSENRPNLKIVLRPADRLTAMSNLLQLLESKAFAFTYEEVQTMVDHMGIWALKYGPSQGALFIVTCKSVFSLLDYRIVDTYDSDKEPPFLDTDTEDCEVSFYYFGMLLNLVEHYMTQQLDDKNFFLQICKRMGEFLPKFDSMLHENEYLEDNELLKTLLKLVDHYKTQKLSVLDSDETVLLQIRTLIDGVLKNFDNSPYEEGHNEVICEFIHSENRVYRAEMTRALLRNWENTASCFKMLSGGYDGDSSDSYSSDSDGSFSSAESEP